MAYVIEEPFVAQRLKDLWAQSTLKLLGAHHFPACENYWFGERPSDPEENERVLGTIDGCRKHEMALKPRGFYVDVTEEGHAAVPQEVAVAEAVRSVTGHLHQIGWQLRLGEHVEAESQLQQEKDMPPATAEEIENMRTLMLSVDPEIGEQIVESMREEKTGKKLNNAASASVLPRDPFENVGRPGYETPDCPWSALMEETSECRGEGAATEDVEL